MSTAASPAPAAAPSLNLWPGLPPCSSPESPFIPTLDLYPLDPALVAGKPRGAVLVLPGGGYGGRAAHEGINIAQRFNAAGLHAFVCQYRVSPNRHPAPLLDAARALRLIRHHAAAWGVDPAHIAVCGFSAGGHLCGSLGTHYDEAVQPVPDAIDALSARPDALILSYPVLSSGPFAHRGSFNNLLGANPDPAMLDYMSLENQVNAQTPPSFLWSTADDGAVPVENSLLFAMALRKHRVPLELHVYPTGSHGLGLAPQFPAIATWMDLCVTWLYGMNWK